MKKIVGMALAEKVMKQSIYKCDMMFSQLHAQWVLPYDTISRGVWPHLSNNKITSIADNVYIRLHQKKVTT